MFKNLTLFWITFNCYSHAHLRTMQQILINFDLTWSENLLVAYGMHMYQYKCLQKIKNWNRRSFDLKSDVTFLTKNNIDLLFKINIYRSNCLILVLLDWNWPTFNTKFNFWSIYSYIYFFLNCTLMIGYH